MIAVAWLTNTYVIANEANTAGQEQAAVQRRESQAHASLFDREPHGHSACPIVGNSGLTATVWVVLRSGAYNPRRERHRLGSALSLWWRLPARLPSARADPDARPAPLRRAPARRSRTCDVCARTASPISPTLAQMAASRTYRRALTPRRPRSRAAQRVCARLAPGASASGSSLEADRPRLLAVARCMREHGLPNFPDPTTTPPPSPPPGARTGNVIGGPGAYLHLPPPSPALTHACAACGFGIR